MGGGDSEIEEEEYLVSRVSIQGTSLSPLLVLLCHDLVLQAGSLSHVWGFIQDSGLTRKVYSFK